MTAPTTCTNCGGELSFPRADDVRAAAKELEAVRLGEDPRARAIIAVGMAAGLLKMAALCIEGVCVFCQPIGGEEPAPKLAELLRIGIEPQWTGGQTLLTKAERRKLAKAARELAGEYAEGRGPELQRFSWCGCAAGQIFRRAGVPDTGGRAAMLDSRLGCLLTGATGVQVGVWGGEGSIPGAVVFPLLYVADWLDAQR